VVENLNKAVVFARGVAKLTKRTIKQAEFFQLVLLAII